MQIRGGEFLDGIVNLFSAAGLNNNYVSYSTFDEAEEGMAVLAGGLDKRFGFAYSRSNNIGHMIVATYDATQQSCLYYDHQIDADGQLDASQGIGFHLFPQ
jgi:hypothetical protein